MEKRTFDWKVVAVTMLFVILASCQVPGDGDGNVQSNETETPSTNDSEIAGDWMLVNVVDNQELRYDPMILAAFETSEEVPVVVDVRHPPMPPVPEEQTLEEFKALVAEQRRLRGERTDAVLATLPDGDSKRLTKVVTEDSFFGNVTKDSFEVLMRNPDVETIYWGWGVDFNLMRKSIDTKEDVYIEPAVLEAFENSTEVKIMVRTRDTTGIRVTADMPVKLQERLKRRYHEVMKRKTDAILSSLPDSASNQLKKFYKENGFYGYVTRPTLEKISQDSDVAAIYLDRFWPGWF